MMYNNLVKNCFFNPRHVGVINRADPLCVYYREGEVKRGDLFDLYLLGTANGFILQARFKAYGNPYLLAGVEWVCQQLQGSLITQHPQITHALLVKELAIPKTHYSVALQIEDGYRGIIRLMNEKLK